MILICERVGLAIGLRVDQQFKARVREVAVHGRGRWLVQSLRLSLQQPGLIHRVIWDRFHSDHFLVSHCGPHYFAALLLLQTAMEKRIVDHDFKLLSSQSCHSCLGERLRLLRSFVFFISFELFETNTSIC